MKDLICYKMMPEWDIDSLPPAFQKQHNTKVGTWAKLTIMAGSLKYYEMDKQGNIGDTFILDSTSDIPFIEPQAWHKVEPLSDDLRCQLAFYCKPEDYYHKKYELTATHSEVLDVVNFIQSGTALDVGCGSGRNALFLQQQGFDITAFDVNSHAIENLNSIIAQEQLDSINAYVGSAYDTQQFKQSFDLVISTVVLMFLDKDKIADVIKMMQNVTNVGGYNLIVCAVDSDDYPMSAHDLPFAFGFEPNELARYYQNWALRKYNENVGHLHRLDANGNPIALRFATMIAQKK